MPQITNSMIENWLLMLNSDDQDAREAAAWFLRCVYRKELKKVVTE